MPNGTENFSDAMHRHYNDAILLKQNSRFDNAVYHAGFAVECGLKKFLQASNYTDPRRFRHKINEALVELQNRIAIIQTVNTKLALTISNFGLIPICFDNHPQYRYWRSNLHDLNATQLALDYAEKIERCLVQYELDTLSTGG